MNIDKIKEMIGHYPEKGVLPCPVAFYIASLLSIAPIEVGKCATEMKIKITQCQLGLFGYGRKGFSNYKVIGKKVEVPESFNALLEKASDNKRISCADLWQIAMDLGITKFEAGNAADALGYKIRPCALGCF